LINLFLTGSGIVTNGEDPEVYINEFLDKKRRKYFRSKNKNLIRLLYNLYEFGYNYYFKVEVKGKENFPYRGPALLVGNHEGAIVSPSMLMTVLAWYKEQGTKKTLFSFAHNAFFKIPYLSSSMEELGAILNNQEDINKVFKDKGFILTYPGGAKEAFKETHLKYKVNFYNHKGFIRLAIREKVPLIPVVTIGGHDTLLILSSGESISKSLKLNKLLGLDVLPLSFSLPWGIGLGPFLPYIPFPTKIKVYFGKPIHLNKDTTEKRVIDQYYTKVVRIMQKMLDDIR